MEVGREAPEKAKMASFLVVLPSSVLGEYFSVSRAQHSPGKPTKRRKRKREEKGGGGIPHVQFSGSSSRMNCMCAAAESSTEKNQQTIGARCASADLSSNENPTQNGQPSKAQ